MTYQGSPANGFIKIVLVGDPGVGKTSLLVRYTENKFSEVTMANIGPGVDYKRKMINIDGKEIELRLWDTAGQERFRSITDSFYKGTHGILLVFDVTDGESYSRCANWNRDMERYLYQRPDIVRYMVGNKIDIKRDRMIAPDAAKELAEKFEMNYMETSALDDINVTETFENMARDILRGGVLGGDSYEDSPGNVIQIRKVKEEPKKKSACCEKS